MFPKCIDLTSLHGSESAYDILDLCTYASANREYIAGVCVNPKYVRYAYKYLGYANTNPNSDIKIVTVVNFPLGKLEKQFNGNTFKIEILQAEDDGVDELDMPIDWQKANEGTSHVFKQTENLVDSTKKRTKIILETGNLTRSLLEKACWDACEAGAEFLKTSTGKTNEGADLEAIRIMCNVIHDYYLDTGHMVGIKPSGGIKTVKQCLEYINLIEKTLRSKWLTPEFFRLGIGFNSAKDIIKELNGNN